MKQAIEAREIITIAEGGISLLATYHKPQDQRSDSSPGIGGNNRIGILFLNSGFHPRAATGDAAVYWADSFAAGGYPSFRLDLPGLGDSGGELPIEVLDFVNLSNTGHYALLLSNVTRKITERFNLSGVVIVSHCAGAASASYVAAASTDIKGLVLLNPYFHREEAPQCTGIRNEFRAWIPRSRLAGYLSKVYGQLKHLSRCVRGSELPNNANVPLVDCWNQLASSGLPMLVLRARALNARVGDFDYIRYVQSGHLNQRIEVEHIETNHAFVKGLGKEAVKTYTEQWLRAFFPVRCKRTETGNEQHSSPSPTEVVKPADSLAGTRT